MHRARLVLATALTAALWGVAGPAAAREAGIERRLLDPRITESSGLAASNRHDDVLWTHNDSGDVARIFAVGADGRTRATYRLGRLVPRDWEAMAASTDAAGRRWLWVGDIGDNSETRTQGILVHRVAEPEMLRDGTLTPTSYRLRYPDGPHDAEALLVHPRTGRLYVVTKEIFGGRVYRAPAELDADGPNRLEALGDAPPVVTDGVFLPDGRAVLRDYGAIIVVPSLDDSRGEREAVSVTMPDTGDQPSQAESIALGPKGTVLVGTEGARSPVLRVKVPQTSKSASAQTPEAPAEPARPQPAPSPRGLVLAAAAVAAVLAGAVLAATRRRR